MRASEFNILVESFFPGTWILFNSFSGALWTLPEDEMREVDRALDDPASSSNPDLLDRLLGNGFLTDLESERVEVRRRHIEALKEQAASGNLSLTIAPTVSCNFRCTYCFEKHPARSMKDWDTSAILRFAEGRLKQGGALSVTWFGGEPLAAFPSLVRTYDALEALVAEREGSFSHSIITNGWLLDGERLDWLEAKEIKSVQVTLDGPAQIHDARRPRAGGKGTYERILANIAAACRRIPIVLRVNVDRRNCGDLSKVADDLIAADVHEHVSVYLGRVIAYTEESGDLDEVSLGHRDFALLALEYRLHLLSKGFRNVYPPRPEPVLGALCTADSPVGYVLSPRGVVTGCWNETAIDPKLAGASMRADGTVLEEAQSRLQHWRDYNPFAHAECDTCHVQPLCKGGCPWESERRPTQGPGDCSPLRFTLAADLRLHHWLESMKESDAVQSTAAFAPSLTDSLP